MAEGYINLFEQEDFAGTNRPHYKGYLKIDGVDHEFALWPAKDGKKGFSGKYKPKQERPAPAEPKPQSVSAQQLDDEKIPF